MSHKYTPLATATRFFVPKTLKADFDLFLLNDIPGSVGNFTVYKDWYKQKLKYIIRGLIYPDSTKSRYSDTDNNLNFRASTDSGIKKGDMISDLNDTIYLLDWLIAPQSNNRASRSVRCNMITTFKKFVSLLTDKRGFLINELGYEIVADSIPCNSYRYDGRPLFSAVSGTPGVVSGALTITLIQYNSKTKHLKVDDVFEWGKDTFTIIDIDYTGVNMNNDSGVLRIQSKKKAGGLID